MLVNIAIDDAYHLGILSSSCHVKWALAQGGVLGPTPRYNKTRCFETFPFPPATPAQKQNIRTLAERLDAHRKSRQAEHPKLTMTGMYNVLEQVRAGEPLTEKEQTVYEQGLIGILGEVHDELDRAVAEAYGWPHDLDEQEILQRLVDLNAERAAEEARGHVRWLRPDYQAPDEQQGTRATLDVDLPAAAATVVADKRKWPKQDDLTAQVGTLRELLQATDGAALNMTTIAAAFKPRLSKTKQQRAEKLLEMMASLGQAERVAEGWRA